jgi:transcriptional regulator NrdR family protein
MKCQCGGETKVIETRMGEANLRRRRECLKCQERFTTYELRVDSVSELWQQLQVAKRAFVEMGKIVKGIV